LLQVSYQHEENQIWLGVPQLRHYPAGKEKGEKMNNVLDAVKYIIANWGHIAEAIAAIIGAASIIVKITPTLKDDNILLGIIKFVGKWIALDKYGPTDTERPK